MSAAGKAHRLATSCTIKRLRNRGTPVNHHWLAMFIGYSKPADMKTFNFTLGFTKAIDASEYKRRITQIQLGETQYQLFVKSVALVSGLECATRVGFIESSDAPSVGAAALKALICPFNMGLFGREVWVMLAHFGVFEFYRLFL
jgi:hypothetical protein